MLDRLLFAESKVRKDSSTIAFRSSVRTESDGPLSVVMEKDIASLLSNSFELLAKYVVNVALVGSFYRGEQKWFRQVLWVAIQFTLHFS